MISLTKLGDVAKYLRAGDLVRHHQYADALEFEKPYGSSEGASLKHPKGGGLFFGNGAEVELVNPRWVPYYTGPGGDTESVVLSHGKVMTKGEYLKPTVACDGNAKILCRETNGHLEPVRAETGLPREARGSELRPGDICTVDCARTEWLITKACVSGAYAGRAWHCQCAGRGVGIILHTDFVAILSRNNLIPGDEQSASTPPYRVATRADVRAGMLVSTMDGNGAWPEPSIVVACSVTPGCCMYEQDAHGLRLTFNADAKHGCRPVRIYSEPESQPTPQPDHDHLRREWDYLAERTPWEAMAAIHVQREWAFSCAPDPEQAVARDLKAIAGDLIDRALRTAAQCAKIGRIAADPECHMLVVIEGASVLFYAEALNGAAYREKCAELWPEPVKPTKWVTVCKCGAMCGPVSMTRCGDCLMVMERESQERNGGRLSPVHHAEGRFRGLAPAPAPDNLTPAQRYHLQDDIDVYGIPGGHH